MGICVFVWYLVTSLFAVIFGTIVALAFNPTLQGAGKLSEGFIGQVTQMQQNAHGSNAFLNIIYGLFSNPFQALASGNFLAVIVFSILFGLAIRCVLDSSDNENTSRQMNMLIDLLEAAQKAMFKIIEWVMLYFPIGVFALTASCFAS